MNFYGGCVEGIVNFRDSRLPLSTPLRIMSSTQRQAYIINLHVCARLLQPFPTSLTFSSDTFFQKLPR